MRYRAELFLVGAALVALTWTVLPGFRADLVAYERTLLRINDPAITAISPDPSAPQGLRTLPGSLAVSGESVRTADLHLNGLTPGTYGVIVHRGGRTVQARLLILDRLVDGGLTGAGILLVVVLTPGLLFRSTNVLRKDTRQALSGWHYLLSEREGLSLSRFQLAIWFVPAIIVYGILGWPTHQFPAIPDTLWQLLGLSTATATLGVVASPSPSSDSDSTASPPSGDGARIAGALTELRASVGQAAAAVQPAEPDLVARLAAIQTQAQDLAALVPADDTVLAEPPMVRDLVEDFSGYGDISRYQYLLLCIVSAVVFLGSFLQDWQIPNLPTQVLALVAASQATYLTVKGVKTVQGQGK